MLMVPKKVFLTKGVGVHKEKLQSFEIALRMAGIEKCNLVTVSSIFPPHCKIISKREGIKLLHPGQITFCVMARMDSNEPNRLMAASVGLAMPSDSSQYGYLSEHHTHGETEDLAGDYAEDLAACMLATTLGVEFNEDDSWNARKETWRINDQIYKTRNITQSAEGHKKGLWTTVMAAAVFADYE